MKLLSICIPTYNRKDRLKKMLDHLCKYKTEDIDVIISDNASNDGTEKMIEYYTKIYNVKYFCNKKNMGHDYNYYRIAEEGRRNSAYSLWIGDDDWIDKSFFFEIPKLLKRYSPDFILLNFCSYINKEGKNREQLEKTVKKVKIFRNEIKHSIDEVEKIDIPFGTMIAKNEVLNFETIKRHMGGLHLYTCFYYEYLERKYKEKKQINVLITAYPFIIWGYKEKSYEFSIEFMESIAKGMVVLSSMKKLGKIFQRAVEELDSMESWGENTYKVKAYCDESFWGKKENIENEIEELVQFSKKSSRIILYGAGTYGKTVKKFLDKIGIQVEAFIVTCKDNKEMCCGIPICKIEEQTLCSDECGIILSLHNRHHIAIKQKLEMIGIKKVFLPSNDVMEYMEKFDQGISEEQLIKFKTLFPIATNVKDNCCKRILVICLEELNGLVTITAFLRELRRSYLKSKITLIVQSKLFEFVELCPYVDEILRYDKGILLGYDTLICEGINNQIGKTFVYGSKHLWKDKYDTVFVPQNGVDYYGATFLAMFSGASYRIGFSEYSSLKKQILNHRFDEMYSCVIKENIKNSILEQKLDLIRAMGQTINEKSIEVWISSTDEKFADNLLKQFDVKENTYLVALGIYTNKQNKVWNYQKLYNEIEKIESKYENVRYIIRREFATIVLHPELEDKFSKRAIIDITNQTTIRQMIAVIRKCKVYIGEYNAMMQIMDMYGAKTIEV